MQDDIAHLFRHVNAVWFSFCLPLHLRLMALEVLDVVDVAVEGLFGIELDQADLAVEGLILPLAKTRRARCGPVCCDYSRCI
jgi:hypothetical protein